MIERRARRLGALAATVLFGLAVSIVRVLAAGDPDPRTSPEPKAGAAKGVNQGKQNSGQKKKKNQGTELQKFIDGYHAARALVLDGKYEASPPLRRSATTTARRSPTTSVTPTARSATTSSPRSGTTRRWQSTRTTCARGSTTVCGTSSRATCSRRPTSWKRFD